VNLASLKFSYGPVGLIGHMAFKSSCFSLQWSVHCQLIPVNLSLFPAFFCATLRPFLTVEEVTTPPFLEFCTLYDQNPMTVSEIAIFSRADD